MKKMLSFDNIKDKYKNLSSMSHRDGIFILDKDGSILFANSKANDIYTLHDTLDKVITGEQVCIQQNNKEITLYPMFEDGELTFFFGVIRDLEEMIKIKEFLDDTYERVKTFREDIAHYFFNPIVIAKGYLELVQDHDIEIDDKEKIRKTITAIERIEAVVKNIVINGEIIKE